MINFKMFKYIREILSQKNEKSESHLAGVVEIFESWDWPIEKCLHGDIQPPDKRQSWEQLSASSCGLGENRAMGLWGAKDLELAILMGKGDQKGISYP